MQNNHPEWLTDVLHQFHYEHHAPLLEAVNTMQQDKTPQSLMQVVALMMTACSELGSISTACMQVEGLQDDPALLEELNELVASIQDVKEQVGETIEEFKSSGIAEECAIT
ncbi:MULTISPECIES: hypothetical protein [Enterobacteriaceae]|jgi:phosphoglycerate-specific signal transduction histidine kinase|nr:MULTISPECIES: hypothetical protein [Enterobacteriaceae]MBL5911524.1 hypothetical protein [Enterobacter asburiae]MBL5915251.1 hypothetical protein [Enterobacter asburiae]MDM6714433.1 hypothetical protein [Klebsiella michiganensis]MDM6913803.1 hypothetical protein [Klebsiella michiganensis]MDM6918139.1 hypothetical protein [Klebsiella michiganensis]